MKRNGNLQFPLFAENKVCLFCFTVGFSANVLFLLENKVGRQVTDIHNCIYVQNMCFLINRHELLNLNIKISYECDMRSIYFTLQNQCFHTPEKIRRREALK